MKKLQLLAVTLLSSGLVWAQSSAAPAAAAPEQTQAAAAAPATNKTDSVWRQWVSVPAPPTPVVHGGVSPSQILQPLDKQWLTYSGDYTGKRYSLLNMVNRHNVANLSLAWVTRFTGGTGPNGTGNGMATGFFLPGRGGGAGPRTIVAGLGTGANNNAAVRFSGGALEVNGMIYITDTDNAWAVDAHDGNILWHFYWKTRGGTMTGNRGLGIWHNYLYFEVNDDYLISLDAATGKERWQVPISSFKEQYFSSPAPMVIGNHIIVGTGDDLGEPGFIESYDPVSGRRQWVHYNVPMHKGDPGLSSWPSLYAARHGGGTSWVPGAYDPETHLYIFGTGNPIPGYTTGRGSGADLYTCSLVAINVATGKMAWYFQTSPHDTHDWDSTETPIIVDGMFHGKPRKLLLQGSRNGYFFVLDRVTGQHLLTMRFGTVNNWAKGLTATGAPKLNPDKSAIIPGAWVNGDVTNYPPPSYSPQTGYFYVPENNSLRLLYLIDPSKEGSMGLGGTGGGPGFSYGSNIDAINYQTGTIAWRHPIDGSGGILTTAGHLLFSKDGSYLIALDSKTGKTLWHSNIGDGGNAPETFEMDGKQYVLATGGDQLFAFVLNQPVAGEAEATR